MWWPALISGLQRSRLYLRCLCCMCRFSRQHWSPQHGCASACAFTTTERALTSNRPWAQERRSISMLLPVVKICRGRINTALWLVSISGGSQAFHSAQLAVLNILVSSEVSHRTATMVSRCRACRAWLAHSGYPLGHVPRSPRTAIDACAIRRMLSHLEAHSAI